MDFKISLEGMKVEDLTKSDLVKLIDEQKKQIELQENFLLNISHDLRSPINVILSVLQCLKYESKDSKEIEDKREEYRQVIRRNSLKILKLVDNLIDASKLQKNYYNLEKHNVDIICLIEATVDSINKYAELKNIKVIFDTNVEECMCNVDPQAIDRIVMNLISNALKFSPNGSEVDVIVNVSDKDIKISVEDHGKGISEKDQKIIFNRFVQSRNNKGHSGSGIGLDLVNYLSKAHGGKVELYSKEGIGSNFVVTIPLVKANGVEKKNLIESRSKIEQLEVEFSDIYL